MTTSSNPTTSSLSRPNPSQPPSPNLSSNHHEKSHVIDILPTATAQTHSHLHPFLLLALYAFRFQSLVADPVSTLWSDLPLYAVLQITYAVTCLPQAGSSHQHHAGSSRNDTNAIGEISESSKRHVSASASTLASAAKRKRTHKSDSFPQKVTAAFISLTLTFLLGTPVFALLLILFGAPFTTHTAHTFLCAAHMALLTATPLIYVHGVNGTVWRQICAFSCSADILWGGAMGACIGAWVGAVPIPLDWDRPWQAYPITILTGAHLGFALGQFLARTPLLYGKRINF